MKTPKLQRVRGTGLPYWMRKQIRDIWFPGLIGLQYRSRPITFFLCHYKFWIKLSDRRPAGAWGDHPLMYAELVLYRRPLSLRVTLPPLPTAACILAGRKAVTAGRQAAGSHKARQRGDRPLRHLDLSIRKST